MYEYKSEGQALLTFVSTNCLFHYLIAGLSITNGKVSAAFTEKSDSNFPEKSQVVDDIFLQSCS